ncbi:MAG: lysoplasmalogenase [Lachnospiraceae bacterium]|nr:lysoplasmalogenase [Lachnospiraceae bacterium]
MISSLPQGLPASRKLTITIALSLFALILALLFPTTDRVICLAAMLLSSVGDIILMNFRKIGEKMPIPYFYAGAVFFMFSHILYTYAFLTMILKNGYNYLNIGFWMAIVIIVITAVAISILVFKNGKINRQMYLLCFAYVMLIGANCATIFSWSFSMGGTRWLAAAGALSFFISDMIIGIDKLLGITSDRLKKAIWVFYPIGQFFILWRG